MKLHLSVTRPAFGGSLTTSLCGRLNAASRDGMNLTGNESEVTCQYCIKRMEANTRRVTLENVGANHFRLVTRH